MKQGILAIFVTLLSISSSYASHLTGGTMHYKCLGNDLYEVTIIVYRDIINGVPPFDNPLPLGIFDGTSNSPIRVENLLHDATNIDTLPSPLFGFGFSRTHYKKTISLPYRVGGYTLAYERCCRNNVISNIVAPSSQGFTIQIKVTENALLQCNSSPIFNTEAILYLCVNDTSSFNYHATDSNNNTLRYALYNPFNGGTTGNPAPNPPNQPPYPPIAFVPGYSHTAPLGSTNIFHIDSISGVLTTFSTTLGTYIAGLIAKEYDATGNLLSESYLEIQVIVGTSCNISTSTEKVKDPPRVHISPIPSNDKVSITITNQEATTIQVLDLTGQELHRHNFKNNTQIDLNALPVGVYLVHLIQDNKVYTKKIIKTE